VVALRVAADEISAEAPPVVLLSDDEPHSFSAAGAIRAWLPVNSSAAEIAAAIVGAAQELFVLTPDQMRAWRQTPVSPTDELQVEKLTTREVEVLRMIADGLGNKEIAEELRVSEHTVKFHVSQVLAKFGVASRTEAVRVGIRRGLVAV
ncbi:MAG: response regulator transcription factor, partial [Acidobacteriaceae bacterium]|nr:response regulator transcription factor [Acidobacteriaceae bacterium]